MRKHTAEARGSGAGAATTCPARKPRESRVIRPVGRDISLAEVVPVHWVRVYIHTPRPDHSGNVCCTQPAQYHISRSVPFCYVDRFPQPDPTFTC